MTDFKLRCALAILGTMSAGLAIIGTMNYQLTGYYAFGLASGIGAIVASLAESFNTQQELTNSNHLTTSECIDDDDNVHTYDSDDAYDNQAIRHSSFG